MNDIVDVILVILVAAYLPFGAWLANKVIKLEVEIAKINQRCSDRGEWLEGIDKTVTKTLTNVVKIAAKLDVNIKE